MDCLVDVLLLSANAARSLEEVFEDLARQSTCLGDLNPRRDRYDLRPHALPVAQVLIPFEYDAISPLDAAARVPTVVLGAHGEEIRIAYDGRSVLIGAYALAGLHGLLGVWVRGTDAAATDEGIAATLDFLRRRLRQRR